MSAVLAASEAHPQYLETVQPAMFREFELLATAPDGVARLRELIVNLALEGRLVPQSTTDEPAAHHVAHMRASKKSLGGEASKARQPKPEDFAGDKKSFGLPPGWIWCRIGELLLPQAGFAFKSSGFNELREGKPLIRIRDVGSTSAPTTYFSGEFRPEFLVQTGEWLVSMDGEFRVRKWKGPVALLNQRVTRLQFFSQATNQTFVGMALQRELRFLQGTKAYTTVDHLSGKQIAQAAIALPPAKEQDRIVARVDELLSLCDALEAKGRLEADQHSRLLFTLLGTLTESGTSEELAANWKRIAAHFDVLLDRTEAIDTLETSIVQLGVRGLLVPQKPQEPTAAASIRAIQIEKDELFHRGEIKRERPSPVVTEAEQRFSVPDGWAWVRLEEIATAIIDCPHSTPKFTESGFLCIDTNSFKGGALIPHKLRFVDHATFNARIERLRPEPGDLVFAREGSVGESLLIPPGTVACLGQRVMLFRLSRQVCNEFVRLAITSTEFLALLLSLHKGIGAKHVNVGDMRKAVIALPPLAEQHRIVARVTQLQALCADLRQRLSAQQTTQARLAEALVESATAA